MLIAVVLATGVSVAAEQPAVPNVTKDFIAQCNSNVAVCSDWISVANISYSVRSIRSNTAGASCIPKAAYDNNGFSVESVNKITAWLAGQPDRSDAATQESLEAAFAAVWPATQSCRDESSDDLPTITGAFAAYCQREDKQHKYSCDEVITDESIVMMFQGSAAFCLPESASGSKAAFKKQMDDVKSWLAAHTEAHARPRHAGIKAAYAALYPCGAK